MMLKAIQGGTPSLFTTIHVLDLAFVFPAPNRRCCRDCHARQPWSYVLAGPLLILSATMMGSLVVSESHCGSALHARSVTALVGLCDDRSCRHAANWQLPAPSSRVTA